MNARTTQLVLATSLCFALLAPGLTAGLPKGNPTALGFDEQALDRMHRFHARNIQERKVAGVVTLVARHGKIVDLHAQGFQDFEAELPMREDTIFRIFSMTKTVVSAGLMQLVEEGRVDLNDPLGNYIPQLAKLKVVAGGSVDNPDVVDADRPITIKMLLTHTSGFGYGTIISGDNVAAKLFDRAEPMRAASVEEFIDRLAALPLHFQPGERWNYGVSIDVVGRVIEIVSGQTLGEFLSERFFEPLRMTDTGFSVPEAKRHRISKIYTHGDNGLTESPLYPIAGEQVAAFEMGGGGLYSTAEDYAVFAQMLLNKGHYGGRRYLGKITVEYMMSNHLAHLERPRISWREEDGFGIGGSVRETLSNAASLGSIGLYGWSGVATTTYRVDPTEGVLFMYLSQHFPYDQFGLFTEIYNSFYQTLTE